MDDSVICAHCGAVSGASSFCPHCGASRTAAPAPAAPAQQHNQKLSTGAAIWAGLHMTIGILFLLGFAFLLLLTPFLARYLSTWIPVCLLPVALATLSCLLSVTGFILILCARKAGIFAVFAGFLCSAAAVVSLSNLGTFLEEVFDLGLRHDPSRYGVPYWLESLLEEISYHFRLVFPLAAGALILFLLIVPTVMLLLLKNNWHKMK